MPFYRSLLQIQAVLACSVAAPFLSNSTFFFLLIAAFCLIIYHHRLQKKKKAAILFFMIYTIMMILSFHFRTLLMEYLGSFIGVGVGAAFLVSVASDENPNSSRGGVLGSSSSPANSTEDSFDINVLLESWPTATGGESAETGTSVNQPAAGPVPPGNAVASTEEAASPARQDPFPYQPDEVIGGDSVLSIQLRLLEKYVFPPAEIIDRARIEAEDLFEVKVDVIRRMTPLDPEGDWLRRGARAFDNHGHRGRISRKAIEPFFWKT